MSGSLGQSLRVEIELVDGGFQTTITRVGNQLRGLEQQMVRTIQGTNNFDRAMQASARSIGAWAVGLDVAARGLERLGHGLGSLVEKVVETNAEIQRTTVLLQGFSHAATEAGRFQEAQTNLQSLMTLASQVPFSFNQVTDTFVKLKSAGIDPMAGSMKGLIDAVAAFGGDDSRLQRAAYALQEMAGRGVVSLTQLRRQLGQDIPGAVQAMADAMGVTIPQLDEMITKGTLNAKNAIALMTEEMERLYGGAASAQIATLRGQVNQLSTSLQRLALAAGGMTEGGYQAGGFYATLIQGMQQLNRELNTPEAYAAAVTLNNVLADLTRNGIALSEALVRVSGPLTTLIQALTSLGAALAISAGIKLFATAVGGLDEAIVNGIAGVRSFGTVLVELLGVLPAAGTWVVRLMQSFYAAAASMVGVTVAAEGATAAIGGLGVALAVAAPTAAIIAGLVLLVEKLRQVGIESDLTADHLKRLIQGDYTPGNEKDARAELDQMRQRLAAIQQMRQQIEDVRAGRRAAVATKDIGAIGDVPGLQAPTQRFLGLFSQNQFVNKTNVDTQAIRDYEAALEKEWTAAKAQYDRFGQALQATPARRLSLVADQEANRQAEEIDARFLGANANYQTRMMQVRQERTANVARPGGPNAGETQRVNEEQRAAVTALYTERLQIVQDYIAKNETILADANAKGLKDQAAIAAKVIEVERDKYAKLVEEARQGGADLFHIVEDSGTKALEAQKKHAETMISDLQARIAGARSQLEGGSNLSAKVAEQLSDPNKLGMIDPKQKEEVQALADAYGKLQDEIKKAGEAQKAITTIDNGFTRAAEQLAAYTEKLDNPMLTDAQQRMVAFHAQMEIQLNNLTNALASGAISWDKYADAVAHANEAEAQMHAATTLGEIEADRRQADQGRVRSLTGGARLAEQIRQRMEKEKQERDNLAKDLASGALNPDQYNKALAQIGSNTEGIVAGDRAASARTGAKAAQPGINELGSLTGRLHELQAEAQGARGEYQRLQAIIDNDPKKYGASAAAILNIARAVDQWTQRVKEHHVAEEALNTLKTRGGEQADRLAQAQRNFADGGRTSGTQKAIDEFIRQQNAEVTKVSGQQGLNPDDTVRIQGEVAEAQKRAQAAITDYTHAQVLERMSALQSETLKLNQSFAISLSERRAAGEQAIELERSQDQKLIDQAQLTADERKKAEDDLAAYIAAKQEDLNRKTEDNLQKLACEWGDTSKNINDLLGQSTSRGIDAMVSALNGGKNSWKDFADWVIKQIERMALQAAMSPLLKLIDPSGSGSGSGGSSSGGILGSLLKWGASAIGSYFGGGAATIGSSDSLGIGANHTGGLIGRESTFTRWMPGHDFRGGVPKFHTGGLVGHDEQLSLLKKGEGVFTQGQMEAIGQMNHSYGMVEKALGGMMNAVLNPPPAAMPAPPSMPAVPQTSGGHGPISVNMHNQSGMNLQPVVGQPYFDGEKMIMDVVIKHTTRPGQFRNILRGSQ